MSENDETTEVEIDDVYTGDDEPEQVSMVGLAADGDMDKFGDEFKSRVFAAVGDKLNDRRDQVAQTFFGGSAEADDTE